MPNEEQEIDPYYVYDLQRQLEEERNKSGQLGNAVRGNQMLQEADVENLIKYQLEFELDSIYHLLRGDRQVEDENGNKIYIAPEDNKEKTFNEFGVQLIMQVLKFYLNKNTILSNYKEETINIKVQQLGNELIDLIYNRYEDMFLYKKYEEYAAELGYASGVKVSTEHGIEIEWKIKDELGDKMKMYPIIIRTLVDTVHSAYLRALHGFENINLRTARSVTQTEPLGRQMGMPTKSKFKLLHPSTWV